MRLFDLTSFSHIISPSETRVIVLGRFLRNFYAPVATAYVYNESGKKILGVSVRSITNRAKYIYFSDGSLKEYKGKGFVRQLAELAEGTLLGFVESTEKDNEGRGIWRYSVIP